MTLDCGWLEELINSDSEVLLKTLGQESPIALLQMVSDLRRLQYAIAKVQKNEQTEKPLPNPYVSRLVNGIPTHQSQEAQTSQEAVTMFAEHQKQLLLEQRLISVATPLLAAMITNQGICLAASATAQIRVEMITQGEMIDNSIELATLLVEKISETVYS